MILVTSQRDALIPIISQLWDSVLMVLFALLLWPSILYICVVASPKELGTAADVAHQLLTTKFGSLSLRVQNFLLTTLQERTQGIYAGALTSLSSELDELGLNWSALDSKERDIVVSEILFDREGNDVRAHN